LVSERAGARPEEEELTLADLASGRRIAQEVERVLRDAEVRGQLPTPVEDIVAAAGLHRGSDDMFDESVLARAPRELQNLVRGLSGKVRAMLDRREREVYVHPGIQIESRRNFQTLHEVGHDILPWQAEVAYADDDQRLSWSTKIRFEQEANQAAAEMLFQRDLFKTMAAEYEIGFAAIVELCEKVGASIHSGTRRYAETHRAPVCALVFDQRPIRKDPLTYRRREAVHSPAWAEQFAPATVWPTSLSESHYPFVSDVRQAQFLSPVGGEWTYEDLTGERIALNYELFSNSYRTFALIWVPQREWLKRRRRLVVPTQ
jgi:hypothetical protein